MILRFIAVIFFAFICLDTDEFTYAVKLARNYPAPFSLDSYGELVEKTYRIGLFSCAVILLAYTATIRSASLYLRVVILGVITYYSACATRMILEGHGIGSPLQSEVRGFIIYAGSIAAAFIIAGNVDWIYRMIRILTITVSAKCLVAFGLYAMHGGIYFVGPVPSVEIDGGFLMLCVAATIASLWLLASTSGRLNIIINISTAAISLATIVTSYRRQVVVYLAIIIALWWLFRCGKKHGLLKGVSLAIIQFAFASAVIVSAYSIWFGWDLTYMQLESLFDAEQSNTAQSMSSRIYKDDWATLWKSFPDHWIAGTGVKNDLVFSERLMDQTLTESEGSVGLHVGTYELWLRMGILGATYQIIYYLVIPITLLFKSRSVRTWSDLILCCISFMLVIGLFPHTGFHHYNLVFNVIAGASLGTIIRLSSDPGKQRGQSSKNRPQTKAP